jgi:hypothetical protein
VLSLDRSGRTREACERLRQAQQQHNVATPDEGLLERCRRLYSTQLRPEVQLDPQVRIRRDATQVQRVPAPSN